MWGESKGTLQPSNDMEVPPIQPELEVIVQPNKYQKRRYTSDGPTRGQIKGATNDRLPTVRLNNYSGRVLMYMMACTSNAEPHPFFELQSVDKCGCQASTLDGRPAVITETSPEKGMEARFAACLKRLSIREVQNISEDNYAKWKHESEVVRLGFLAVCLVENRPLASRLSSPIHMVQGKQPELKRIIPSSGSVQGDNIICITGKNFPTSCNLKVRFYHQSGGELLWEAYGDADPNDCSEKHLVVTVPRGPSFGGHVHQVNVEVTGGATMTGKQKSRTLTYCYQSGTLQHGGPGAMQSDIKDLITLINQTREKTGEDLAGIMRDPSESRPILDVVGMGPLGRRPTMSLQTSAAASSGHHIHGVGPVYREPSSLSSASLASGIQPPGHLSPWLEPDSPLPPYSQPPSVEPMDVPRQVPAMPPSSQHIAVGSAANIPSSLMVKTEMGLPRQPSRKRRSSPDHHVAKTSMLPAMDSTVFSMFTAKPQMVTDINRDLNPVMPAPTMNHGPGVYGQSDPMEQYGSRLPLQHGNDTFDQLLNPTAPSASNNPVIPPDWLLHHDRYNKDEFETFLQHFEKGDDTG